jgi:phosphoribosylglycinamide formyltransferase-1
MTLAITVLASGRGTNLQALVDGVHLRADVDARIVGVISDRPGSGALGIAHGRGISAACIDHRRCADRDAFEALLATAITGFGADLLVLAGFMRVLGTAFVERFSPAMINIHPSLLPRYPGLRTHARALEAGDREHGASVHLVTPQVDAGPLIAQVVVPVEADDDPARLASRVLAGEHLLYPEVVRWIAAGRLSLAADGGPRLDGAPLPPRGRRFRVVEDQLEPLPCTG